MHHLINMKKIIFILFVLATLPICTYAQGEVKDSVSVDAQEIKESVEVQTIDVTELQKQIRKDNKKPNPAVKFVKRCYSYIKRRIK